MQRYRAGTPPSELQWAMRLKHLGTLEHYLQELAAVAALTEVSPHGRTRIRTAAKLYDPLSAGPFGHMSSFSSLPSSFQDFRTSGFMPERSCSSAAPWHLNWLLQKWIKALHDRFRSGRLAVF